MLSFHTLHTTAFPSAIARGPHQNIFHTSNFRWYLGCPIGGSKLATYFVVPNLLIGRHEHFRHQNPSNQVIPRSHHVADHPGRNWNQPPIIVMFSRTRVNNSYIPSTEASSSQELRQYHDKEWNLEIRTVCGVPPFTQMGYTGLY